MLSFRLALLALFVAFAAAQIVVKTTYGPIVGVQDGQAKSFKVYPEDLLKRPTTRTRVN